MSQTVTQVGKAIGVAEGEDSDLHTEGVLPSTIISAVAMNSDGGECG